MKTFTEPARKIPVYAEVDVVVIGGGPAGAAAAIAGARQGADTLLIEKQGCLGGSLTASLRGVISGFRSQRHPDAFQAVRGMPREIIYELQRIDGIGKSPHEQQEFDIAAGQLSFSYAVDTEKLKLILLRMAENALCDILLHTYATAPIMADNRVAGVIVENRSGRQAIFAKVVIDCSDDGEIAFRAGALPRDIIANDRQGQGPHLMYKVAGFQAGESLPVPAVLTKGSMVIAGPEAPLAGSSAFELTRAEIDARTRVLNHFDELRREYPALAGACLVETASRLATRRMRYVFGEHVITEHDALSGARFSDVIAISAAPIPNWYGSVRFLDHDGFDVPYRSLLPRNTYGLLVAGKGISAEQAPYESLSSAACMMAIGQAAGTAAALAAHKNILPRQINVAHLQELLTTQGAQLRHS